MLQLRLFFTAMQFFTRIPVPGWVGYSPEQLNASARYFPLVGTLVGALAAAVLWGAAVGLQLPIAVAVLLSLAATLLATGAFHEDGFADACDGFGGTPYNGDGSRARILEIMKDSRVGAFGAIGIAMMLMLKVATLAALSVLTAVLALLVAHTASRFAALGVMQLLPYAREDLLSKSKPLATTISVGGLLFASVWLALVWAGVVWASERWMLGTPLILWVVAGIGSLGVALVAAAYFRKRLGGYTGDCLGATQQVSEVVFYIVLLARV
jgi:adenosylcobinamide-GDP ribazoletransferase